MALTVARANTIDAAAVSALWIAQSRNRNSWWFNTGEPDARAILAKIQHPEISIGVVYDGRDLVGFGQWIGRDLAGFTALNREAFYRLMLLWCEGQEAEVGRSIIPARVTNERTWLDEIGVMEDTPQTPLGHHALKRGEARASRVVANLRIEGPLAKVKAATQRRLDQVVGKEPWRN